MVRVVHQQSNGHDESQDSRQRSNLRPLPREDRSNREGMQMIRPKYKSPLMRYAIIEQRLWIEERGGNLAGYVARFGECKGALMYAADMAALAKYEARLDG